MKRSELRHLIQRAELKSTILRQPGFISLSRGERIKLADDLADLAQLARRYFDVETLDVRPLLAEALEDDATEDDLFGGAA